MEIEDVCDKRPATILTEAARLRECALDAAAIAADQFRRAEHELTRLEQEMRCLEFYTGSIDPQLETADLGYPFV